jgi:GNAT superfamily N-acetyltransferase
LEYKTIDHFDPKLWEQACYIYQQAFGQHSAKPERIIRNMFSKQICYLHLMVLEDRVIAMALTGKGKESNTPIIDYLTVDLGYQGQGNGHKLLDYIKTWYRSKRNIDSIIIEVESEQTPENQRRIRFWEKADFHLTEFVHQYKWVPETYQAMYCKLVPNAKVPIKGEALFQYIIQFHKECYREK